MITEQYERAKAILREHKEGHAELAKLLMEREVIFAEDVEKIFGKRPWTSRSEEIFGVGDDVVETAAETDTVPDTAEE
jgi:cell division protease FtsH